MAITFDANSTAVNNSGASLAWSHTCSGGNRLLLVGVAWNGSGITISSVTYGPDTMTQIGSTLDLPGAARHVAFFRLVAPATGANTITVTLSASATGTVGGASSWTGVHQTTPVGTPVTATGTSTTPSVNVSSAADEVIHDSLGVDPATGMTVTVDPSQTERWNNVTPTGSRMRGAGSSEPGTGSPVTMSWSLSVSRAWGTIGVAVKPSAAPAAAPSSQAIILS